MKPFLARVLALPAAALVAVLLAGASDAPVLKPGTLLILSTCDVKGKASPCGCHTPKGGLARRATFADSVRSLYGQVLLVDAGGFFPETDIAIDAAGFMMDGMNLLGTGAVGVGETELRFGIAYLRQTAKRKNAPLVCANLLDRTSGAPVLDEFRIEKAGNVTVGVFGLMSHKVDLGPSRDSLSVADPVVTARRVVPAMRKQGATVIVLLSQLGKVEAEDLVTAVEGIDVAILGHNVPMLQKGRLIGKTVACYGGDQGHFIGRTEVTLDTKGRMASGDNSCVMLGPDVAEKPEIVRIVTAFEDAFNAKMRKREMDEAAKKS